MNNTEINIAYFSAEIGISCSLPTYSGGLGVLAGDHIRAAADTETPICAITLLYREGYYKQQLDEDGVQSETYPRFDPNLLLEKLNIDFSVRLRERDVVVNVYKLDYVGITGHIVPIYFLDTEVEENFRDDQLISLRLYSGNKDHRILQEAILGFGGIRLLEKLGYGNINTYHMNEGHCSFLTLALKEKFNGDEAEVRKRCHFTTHTPVPAGHDHFSASRCKKLLNGLLPDDLNLPSLVQDSRLHMTELGLHFSRSANGVSKLHGDVAQGQFPNYEIGYITNGVHHSYWISNQFGKLFDQYMQDWKESPENIFNIDNIPEDEIWNAHQLQKDTLISHVNSQTEKVLDFDILTVGFARRAATYKRANLIFHDLERLIELGQNKLQIIFAGKAHPNDGEGKALIQNVVGHANKLFGNIKVIYLENYNMWLGKLITSGVDVWLNTPLCPNEASGTSGMKAVLNGVPNLSVLDGWWAEGCRDGKNGWGVGNPHDPNDEKDAAHLYDLLENKIIPIFYNDKSEWIELMRESIKTGVGYTAIRMMNEYRENYYGIKKLDKVEL
jgi:starch phosphorylase